MLHMNQSFLEVQWVLIDGDGQLLKYCFWLETKITSWHGWDGANTIAVFMMVFVYAVQMRRSLASTLKHVKHAEALNDFVLLFDQ